MKIKFYGACKTVTGSCFLVETKDTKVLIDCGMYQGSKALKERNYGEFKFDPTSVDYLILTHAHIDHSGLIPKLIKEGFKGPIIATKATVDLCSIMLPDSGYIQEMEVERKNRKLARAGKKLLKPIYNSIDATRAMMQFKSIDYDLQIKLSPTVSVRLRDAGHILGSAIIEMWVNEDNKITKLVFSGDLGNYNQPIIKDPFIIDEADFLIMETTYGNRYHQNLGDKKEILLNIIMDTFERGGNVIIPAFAVERTQDLLYYLGELEQEKRLPTCEIYIDSPLAISASQIFNISSQYYDEQARKIYSQTGKSPIMLNSLKIARSREESVMLNEKKSGNIIISASGMCDAGRIKHHLKHNIWRPECSVVFVGYQAPGTLGRIILDGQESVRIHGEEVAVKAQIHNIDGFSGHADKNGLLNWVNSFEKKPKKIFLVHGELEGMLEFEKEVESNLGLDVEIPEWQEEFDTDSKEIKPIKSEFTYDDIDILYREVLRKLEETYYGKIKDQETEQLYKKLKALKEVI